MEFRPFCENTADVKQFTIRCRYWVSKIWTSINFPAAKSGHPLIFPSMLTHFTSRVNSVREWVFASLVFYKTMQWEFEISHLHFYFSFATCDDSRLDTTSFVSESSFPSAFQPTLAKMLTKCGEQLHRTDGAITPTTVVAYFVNTPLRLKIPSA